MELWPFGTSYPGKVQNLYSLLMRAPSISCLRMWFEPYRDWNFLRDLFPHSKQRGGKRSTFCSSEERLGFALRMFGYPLRFMMFITTVIAFLESDLLTHQHTVHKYQYIVKVSQERHPQQNCTTCCNDTLPTIPVDILSKISSTKLYYRSPKKPYYPPYYAPPHDFSVRSPTPTREMRHRAPGVAGGVHN